MSRPSSIANLLNGATLPEHHDGMNRSPKRRCVWPAQDSSGHLCTNGRLSNAYFLDTCGAALQPYPPAVRSTPTGTWNALFEHFCDRYRLPNTSATSGRYHQHPQHVYYRKPVQSTASQVPFEALHSQQHVPNASTRAMSLHQSVQGQAGRDPRRAEDNMYRYLTPRCHDDMTNIKPEPPPWPNDIIPKFEFRSYPAFTPAPGLVSTGRAPPAHLMRRTEDLLLSDSLITRREIAKDNALLPPEMQMLNKHLEEIPCGTAVIPLQVKHRAIKGGVRLSEHNFTQQLSPRKRKLEVYDNGLDHSTFCEQAMAVHQATLDCEQRGLPELLWNNKVHSASGTARPLATQRDLVLGKHVRACRRYGRGAAGAGVHDASQDGRLLRHPPADARLTRQSPLHAAGRG